MNDLELHIITLQNNIFSGLFVGQNLITINKVDSTNNYLKDLLSNSKPVSEGTVIMAESQYAGRGQQQNRWHSEDGKNLTFSILLKPIFLPVTQQFDLTRAVSLGIINALEPHLGAQLKIKWPNDIYFENGKLGGILIENIVQGNQIKNSVVGIGLNINQDTFPADVPNAVSLKQILRKDYDLKLLLSDICKNIEAAYLNLKAGRLEFVRNAYLERLYWLNEHKMFKAGGRIFEGLIKEVKDNGLLTVFDGDVTSEYNQKEIEFLNK
ncbi:biotin--[acetyl-CoA-carboxylase] ligase [Mucilaginibacter sp. McL0603]|uniref:biotin--[acetyl-CoA-carboxylase] ligase n=1 Tax=Mucilaginibacter sp. McL0603 TaxID=3415670 RepID=UPI003CF2CFFE